MKSWMIVLWTAWVFPVLGEIKMPKELQSIKEIEEITKLAKKEGELLVFLKVNPKNSQDHVEEAVEDYVSSFKRFGPMVLIKLGWKEYGVPKPVDAAFDSMSGSYPRIVVMDPENDTIVAKVPYTSQSERKKELRELRQPIFRYLRAKKAGPQKPAGS